MGVATQRCPRRPQRGVGGHEGRRRECDCPLGMSSLETLTCQSLGRRVGDQCSDRDERRKSRVAVGRCRRSPQHPQAPGLGCTWGRRRCMHLSCGAQGDVVRVSRRHTCQLAGGGWTSSHKVPCSHKPYVGQDHKHDDDCARMLHGRGSPLRMPRSWTLGTTPCQCRLGPVCRRGLCGRLLPSDHTRGIRRRWRQ